MATRLQALQEEYDSLLEMHRNYELNGDELLVADSERRLRDAKQQLDLEIANQSGQRFLPADPHLNRLRSVAQRTKEERVLSVPTESEIPLEESTPAVIADTLPTPTPTPAPVTVDWEATKLLRQKQAEGSKEEVTVDWEATKRYRMRGMRLPAREPDFIDTTIIIGSEIVPAIVGAFLGSFAGPKGTIVGGAAGSALGNAWSQNYRIERGFQEEFGGGEFVASTALGGIPSVTGIKSLKNIGGVTRTAIRSAEGAGLATGEMLARTYIDEGRAPTREEIATTVLFGGTFGGGLGALEAKWLGKNLVDEAEEGMTRPEVLKLIENKVRKEGGPENFEVGRPMVQKLRPRDQNNVGRPLGLPAPKGSDVVIEVEAIPVYAKNVLNRLENQLLLESEGHVSKIARIRGEEATGEMAALQKSFDEQLAQDDEIFTPLMREVDLGTQQVGDNVALREIQQSIAMLDHKHGKNKGASNQRKKLNAEKQRILRRNNLLLDDLEAEMQGRQMPPNRQDIRSGDQPMKQADPMTKSERMAEDKLGPNYEKYFNIAMGVGASGAAGYAMFADEEDGEQMAMAGVPGPLAFLLAAIGIKGKSLKKFLKTKKFKKLNSQAKRDPQSVEPTAMKSQRVANAASRDFAPKAWWSKVFKDVKSITSNVLTPISRQIKNLDKKLGTNFTRHFRDYDLRTGRKTAALMKGAMPFMKSMSNALKKRPESREKFDDLLLEGDFNGMVILIDELNLPQKVSQDIKLELKQMRETLDEIRSYAREEGGFDVGYIEDYFPRKVRDYKELREFMDNDPELRAATNEIDKAIDEFAAKNKVSRDDLTPEELAEVTSRVIRGYPVTGTIPSNFKPRSIFDKKTLNKIRKAYESPEDALESYIRGTVDAVERKKFIGIVKPSKGQGIQGEGFQDTIDSDIGMRAKVDESLADALAQDLLKGTKFGQEDVEKLRKIIQSRFAGGTEGYTVRGLKNLGYLQVMTNFGSAITQLADQVFSIHFNGFGNHFKTLFNRKDMFNFAELTGLSQREFENMGNSDKLSGLLDNLFRKTGLKQLDLFAKNAYMNAAWRKYHKLAQSEGGSQKLREELLPYFGDRTDKVIKAVRSNAPTNKEPPAEVTELVFHKLLDVAPATASEVPANYMKYPNLRIMYMLKTFTIKQIDAFRTAGVDNIQAGGKLYMAGRAEGSKSKQEKGARLAAKGTKDLVQIAALFAAANAGTDVIKDVIYGRPIKRDELIENNLWKLIGINRYTFYNAKRRGVGKAFIDTLAPPTAFFDRAGSDISAIVGDGKYKGAMLQGTPLDLIYWRYLGGLDKIKNTK